jgi:glycine hydroxymethyltransferase
VAKAVAFLEASRPEFRDYCVQVVKNAQTLAKALMAKNVHVVSGGTDNHLMLCDLRPRGATLTGKLAENALDRASITVNKNTVPKETQSPFVTSGIRIGTPAVTTRGMGEQEMVQIAELIDRVLAAPEDAAVTAEVKRAVHAMTAEFPLYL